ncbi:MAG: deoxyuridine 5'-triphosphate nucleotidohydrolase [Clostridia bacterium]|nr:deoxyuridine 5'-triphosphate nucleotidohydrolase [Clostridia bacterium]
MIAVAQFELVSKKQFEEAWLDTFGEPQQSFDRLQLPKRATTGSAGYDFLLPCDITLEPGKTIKIPTGIRAKIEEGWMLQIFPRSGLGFKFRLQLDNTVGIIDSDYYGSDNEGHIFIKITNDSRNDKTVVLKEGDAFAQGIFVPYGVTFDDETTAIRNGGMGSTSR